MEQIILYVIAALTAILFIAVLAMHRKNKKLHAELNEIIADIQKRASSVKRDQQAGFQQLNQALDAARKTIQEIASDQETDNIKLSQLEEELKEQKKILDFYINIDEAAGGMIADEDASEPERPLEPIEQQNNQHTDNWSDKKIQLDDSEAIAEKLPDEEQEFARNYIETCQHNVFITGKAGTGKSFLLDVFRRTTGKKHIVLAPTGIAALNVKGATLHTTFGYRNLVDLDVDDINWDTFKLKDEKQEVLRKVNTIIIDEISMVRADTFDKIDRILKLITGVEEPFGGKQMILFGDLFQLPPVAKKPEIDYLKDRYGGIFFFNSDAYKQGDFKFIELTHNHRQKNDRQYFEILNRIRMGHTTDQDIALLNTRYTPDQSVYDRFINLFPTKAEANKVNQEQMDQLLTKEYTYTAKILLDSRTNQNTNLENIFPVLSELKLKLGASVMMVSNDASHRWVNGTIGIVKSLTDDKIYVSFGKNRVFDILPSEFEEYEIKYKNNKLYYETIFKVLQYPMIPAYAITIHKSQGQTYEKIACDIDRCFATGQAYVALSRCVSLEGLHLKSQVSAGSIKVNHDILDFYLSQMKNDLLRNKASAYHD